METRTYIIVLLLALLPCLVYAKETQLHNSQTTAMSTNTQQEVMGNISNEDYTCLKMAEFGEHLAVKKIKGVPLADILQKIEYAQQALRSHKGKIISANTFKDMVIMAKQAYSQSYESDIDVQSYVEDLYRTCLKRHI